MSKDNGGPAFPDVRRLELLRQADIDPQTKETIYIESSGMTLRDWFAAKALNIAKDWEEKSPTFGGDDGTYRGIAVRAYRMADAMLAERNKP